MNKKDQLKAVAIYLLRRRKLIKVKTTALMLALLNFQRMISALCIQQEAHTRMQILLYNFKRRQALKSEGNSLFWENDVPKMNDSSFKNYFRVNRQSFKKICEKVKNVEKQDTRTRLNMPIEKSVAIALYALGSTSEYSTVSEIFRVKLDTVLENVTNFCRIVCDAFGDYISSYPPTVDEIKRVVDGFERLGFPQCFGAIDAYHLEFKPKEEQEFEYYNSEGWYSIILLASCDHNSKFTYANIGTPGRKTNYSVFRNSSLKRFHELSTVFLENSKTINGIDVPALLIGDSSYSLSNCLMQPYPFKDNQPNYENVFNNRLQKCHRMIEIAFIQLRSRFQKIEKLKMSLENSNIIIKACCYLHNFLKIEEDNVNETWIEDSANFVRKTQPNHVTDAKTDDEAEAIRNAIARSFCKVEN